GRSGREPDAAVAVLQRERARDGAGPPPEDAKRGAGDGGRVERRVELDDEVAVARGADGLRRRAHGGDAGGLREGGRGEEEGEGEREARHGRGGWGPSISDGTGRGASGAYGLPGVFPSRSWNSRPVVSWRKTLCCCTPCTLAVCSPPSSSP